jgi:hypothetical protein
MSGGGHGGDDHGGHGGGHGGGGLSLNLSVGGGAAVGVGAIGLAFAAVFLITGKPYVLFEYGEWNTDAVHMQERGYLDAKCVKVPAREWSKDVCQPHSIQCDDKMIFFDGPAPMVFQKAWHEAVIIRPGIWYQLDEGCRQFHLSQLNPTGQAAPSIVVTMVVAPVTAVAIPVPRAPRQTFSAPAAHLAPEREVTQ